MYVSIIGDLNLTLVPIEKLYTCTCFLGVPGNITSSTPSPSAPSLSTHDQRVTSVPHLHLQEAISTFDDTPLSEGGCKLGQGGFGTVYYCRLPLGGVETEVAVKVFSDNVRTCFMS